MIRASLRSLIGLLDWTRARLQGVDLRTPVTIHAQSILLIITHSLTDCKKFKLKYTNIIFDNINMLLLLQNSTRLGGVGICCRALPKHMSHAEDIAMILSHMHMVFVLQIASSN